MQAPNFKEFRNVFNAKLESLFVVPARTFDNVKGSFPIGFFIWDTKSNQSGNFSVEADAYDEKGNFISKKQFSPIDDEVGNIGKWVSTFKDEKGNHLGFMSNGRNDFQNQSLVYFMNDRAQMPTPRGWWITPRNLIVMGIFVAVRHCIEATWLNDRDQFLYPNDGWQDDREFLLDCLIYTLFHGQNRISATQGTNHFIPFTEQQVGCRKAFKSTFMSDYLRNFLDGKISLSAAPHSKTDLFTGESSGVKGACPMSVEAQAVYDSGLSLWKYYHSQKNANPDASFYDIRKYFQGEKNGRMNSDSDDETYTALITDLRAKQKILAKKIEAGVYKYGFLR